VRFGRHGSGVRGRGKAPRPPAWAGGTVVAPSARRRPGYPLMGCSPAEPTSVSPGGTAIPQERRGGKSNQVLPVTKTGRSVAKERSFIVQRMGSTSADARTSGGDSSCRRQGSKLHVVSSPRGTQPSAFFCPARNRQQLRVLCPFGKVDSSYPHRALALQGMGSRVGNTVGSKRCREERPHMSGHTPRPRDHSPPFRNRLEEAKRFTVSFASCLSSVYRAC
jgi:hypothetical protein